MRELGLSSLFFSFIFGILSFIFYIYGFYKKDRRFLISAKRSLISEVLLIIISSISLIYLLLTKDYEIEYVASYVNNTLSLLYTFSAFWAGLEGSLLFWSLVQGIFLLFLFYKNKNTEIDNYSYFFLNSILLFFITLTLFFANPFKKLPFKISDGNGLNPLLQNFWMLIHPPFLYLGYIGFSIPFAYTLSFLILKSDDEYSRERIRKWSLFSWLLLSIGIFTGGKWAYVELGWGGYWGWDPVENASFLPWLTGAAFLHTQIIEKREKIFKRWNIFLIFLTFSLVILGTYITRSGIISSVHAFSESKISPPFIIFLIIISVFFFYLFITRYKLLKSESKIEDPLTKEGNFYLLSIILIIITIIIFIGTFYPLLSEIITGEKMSLGIQFFNTATPPFFVLILFLLSICPHLGKRKFILKDFLKKTYIQITLTGISFLILFFSGVKKIYPLITYTLSLFFIYSFLANFLKDLIYKKNILKYSSYLIHLGIIITGIGISASNSYKIKEEISLKEDEQIEIGNFLLHYKGIDFISNPHYEAVSSKIFLKENGKYLGILKPEMRFYRKWEEPSSEIDIIPKIEGDIYIVLKGFDKEKAYFEFHYNPLINFVWSGIIFIIIGGIILIIKR
ncbi:MAG: cytochrome c-type biogenesis CcmF C-terminal domain-containing protein [candidate division WOR-3 bacterium]